MSNYRVGVTIHNRFDVEAENEDEAETKVRELDPWDTLEHCELRIEYIEEESVNEKETNAST